MTDTGTEGEPAAKPRRPLSMNFRKRSSAPMLTREQSKRQSDVIQVAWRHFRDAAPMMAFLNTRDEALDGQPLQLAIHSDDGLARVETLLNQQTLGR